MYGMNPYFTGDWFWAAVAVDGFIPPFCLYWNFKPYNVLVIAFGYSAKLEHIEYTPGTRYYSRKVAGHARSLLILNMQNI